MYFYGNLKNNENAFGGREMKDLTEKLKSKEMKKLVVTAIVIVVLVAAVCMIKNVCNMCKKKKCCNNIYDEE